MMQGRRHCRPLHGKARAMACGGNPRALPDFIYKWSSNLITVFLELIIFGEPPKASNSLTILQEPPGASRSLQELEEFREVSRSHKTLQGLQGLPSLRWFEERPEVQQPPGVSVNPKS